MKISEFLNNLKVNEQEVVHYCCNHLLSKKFDVENDSLTQDEIKELLLDYGNFNKYLNDSAGTIYRKYEAELNDVYKAICKTFNEEFDNKSLFDFRFARIINQEPKQFLDIEDKDTQETVIEKFQDKINTILESKYYKNNESSLSKEMVIPQRTLELIKSAVS
ncbi:MULTISPECIES: hypothetical protein [Arcobacteraceae]|uniref:Uncharacterized protein n=1 Tax=Poseidonibacter parvus TaxID=1850254 RepID=A0A1P8KM77_9BACT|nr:MULTISPECIES: hypothetical protein [Arcobacteraceae]APW65667.1 hypothetical protein LPB137_07300 [Poseidonibacter parvus]